MRKLTVVCVLMGIVAFGCAKDGADDDGAAATQEPSEQTAAPAVSGKVNVQQTASFASADFSTEIEIDDFYFDPTYIKSPGDGKAKITLKNEGKATHTFTVDDLDVDEELEPGDEKTITVKIGVETRYEYYCRFHESKGMRGAFQPH